MLQEVVIFTTVLIATIITEYLHYFLVIKNSIKCNNISYLSNTVKFDVNEITTYIIGKTPELRISNSYRWSSISLPFTTPVIIANAEMLFNSFKKYLNVVCVIHEACHIMNKSSLKFLIAKALLIPSMVTVLIHFQRQLTTPLLLALTPLTLLITYGILKLLSICDEMEANKCTNNFISVENFQM